MKVWIVTCYTNENDEVVYQKHFSSKEKADKFMNRVHYLEEQKLAKAKDFGQQYFIDRYLGWSYQLTEFSLI